MKFNDYRLIFIAAGLIGVLLIASPALGNLITPPAGEQFSELYLLGPERMLENYPYNVAVGQTYSLYAGVGNHVGSSVYYVLYLKFKNQTDPMPNATSITPSPLPPFYEYRFLIEDGNTWEAPLTFSVSDATITTDTSQINTLQINGKTFNVNKSALFNTNTTTYSYQLLLELYTYNQQSNKLEYNNRYLQLQLNLTSTNTN